MGTTITVALLDDGVVWFGHVGDSRAYLIRDGELEQLTDDHSLVGELVRSGKLSAAEAQTHPQRSVITRAVGTDPDVDVDTFPIEPQPGDVFLICSDGLTDMVDDETILDIVERHRDDLDAAVRELVRAANRSGGEDNITIVAFEVGAEGEEPAALEQTHALGASEIAEEDQTLTNVRAPSPVDTMVVSADRIREHLAASEAVDEPGDLPTATPEVAPEPRTDANGPSAARVAVTLAVVTALILLAALVLWLAANT